MPGWVVTQDGAQERQPTTGHAARNLSLLAQPRSAMTSSCHRAGHPQTSPQTLSQAASVDLGAAVTSVLPSSPTSFAPQLKPPLAEEAFWEQAAAALFPSAFTPAPTSPEHLVTYSVCPSSIVLSKVFSSFRGQHSAHQQGQRFPNWGPQRFCLSITCGNVRIHMSLTPNLLGRLLCR